MDFNVVIGVVAPFLGTVLGSAMVFLLKKDFPEIVEKALLGFAGGVMMAASVFSLLLPSIEQADNDGNIGWMIASLGFLGGIGFLLLLDVVIPHVHVNSDEEEGIKTSWTKTTKLFLAMTLHNIPEGMALGIVFASIVDQSVALSTGAAFALALGIAIQNIPEGAVLSMPLHQAGMSRFKAFLYGSASGIVEPIGAIITIFASHLIRPLLPWLLAFAAGAMVYCVVEELIPSSQHGKHSNIGTILFALGFVCMMILDSTLG